MSSYGNTIKSDTFVGNDVYVDTLHWKTFDPPLSGGGGGDTPTLAAVLDTGDDANGEDIKNANDIECVKVEASEKIETPKCEATLVEANKIEGSGVNPAITGINNISTQNINVTSQVGSGTATGTFNSLNATTCTATTSSFVATTCGVVNTDVLNGTGNPVKVQAIQMRGDLDLRDDASPPVDHNIENVGTLYATGIQATGIQALQASIVSLGSPAVTINGTTAPNSGILNMNASTGGTCKLDFTGVSGITTQDTEIEGDDTLNNVGQPKLTKCTYLDLSDPSNRVPEPTQESYRWGVYFAPVTQIRSDFDDDTTRVFNEDCYFTYFSNNPDHSNMIFELNFFIEEYGYGDIQLQIYYQPSDQSQTRRPLPGSELFYVPEESATAFRSVRKVGQCHASWLVTNMPTDGRGYNFWCAAKTNFSDNGRMIISMRQNGGDPNVENQRGAPVTFQCYPKPTRWRLAP
jgi:hypothetical protein